MFVPDRKNFGYCDKEESPEPRDLPQSNNSSFSEPPQDQAKDLSESNSSCYSDPHQDLPKDFSESTSPLIDHQRNRVNTMSVSEKHVYKYRCNQCSLAFKTAEKLQLHSHYHFIRDATKCVLCSRSFRSILALQKHVESTHSDLSDEEMLLLKQSLLNNPLLLAGLSGKVLDPSITELLKKESMRSSSGYDDESMDEECSNRDPEETCAGAGMIHHNNSEDEEDEHVDEFGTSHAPGDENSADPNRKYTCHKCKEAYPRQQHNYSPLRNKKVPHRKGEKVIYPMEKYLDPNRPYKCEVCKESFTQKNILLVHYNSVSHLHKLKRAAQDMQQNNTGNAICANSAVTSTPACAPQQSTFSSSGQLIDTKTPSPSFLSVASDDSFMETPSSQAAAKKSSQIYRTLLESFGFDLVMQFNENHQRRQRREREENERLLAQIQSSTQFAPEEAVAAADSSTSSPISDLRNECTAETPLCTADDKNDSTTLADQLPESSKSTCVHCNKEFSSVWVLKAHCEEVHKDLVPFDFLEQYAQQIKSEIERKGGNTITGGNLLDREENASSEPSDLSLSNVVPAKYQEDLTPVSVAMTTSNMAVNTTDATTCTSSTTTTSSKASCTSSDAFDKDGNCGDDIDDGASLARNLREPSITSNPPTACSTPVSTTESLPPINMTAMAAAASASGVMAASNNQTQSSLHQSVAQQMNDMQAALNAMAATQLQFNPMMMSMASLGMGLPLGLNVPALAAMNLQPPLVPMMMPPPTFDPMVSLSQAAAQNPLFSQQNANLDATALLAKQQQHLLQQQQAVSIIYFHFILITYF